MEKHRPPKRLTGKVGVKWWKGEMINVIPSDKAVEVVLARHETPSWEQNSKAWRLHEARVSRLLGSSLVRSKRSQKARNQQEHMAITHVRMQAAIHNWLRLNCRFLVGSQGQGML